MQKKFYVGFRDHSCVNSCFKFTECSYKINSMLLEVLCTCTCTLVQFWFNFLSVENPPLPPPIWVCLSLHSSALCFFLSLQLVKFVLVVLVLHICAWEFLGQHNICLELFYLRISAPISCKGHCLNQICICVHWLWLLVSYEGCLWKELEAIQWVNHKHNSH